VFTFVSSSFEKDILETVPVEKTKGGGGLWNRTFWYVRMGENRFICYQVLRIAAVG